MSDEEHGLMSEQDVDVRGDRRGRGAELEAASRSMADGSEGDVKAMHAGLIAVVFDPDVMKAGTTIRCPSEWAALVPNVLRAIADELERGGRLGPSSP